MAVVEYLYLGKAKIIDTHNNTGIKYMNQSYRPVLDMTSLIQNNDKKKGRELQRTCRIYFEM